MLPRQPAGDVNENEEPQRHREYFKQRFGMEETRADGKYNHLNNDQDHQLLEENNKFNIHCTGICSPLNIYGPISSK